MASGTWPKPDESLIAEIVRDRHTGGTLQEVSPEHLTGPERHTEMILETLFPGDQLLCIGASPMHCRTKPRQAWRGHLKDKRVIVPSSMQSVIGKTAEDKPSHRAKESVGPRQFLVIEFDKAKLDEQTALLLHLAKYAPLVMVVFSGGKSLHGWFACAGSSDIQQRQFFNFAVSLGADKYMWQPHQPARLPDGFREKTGMRQEVLFWNPACVRSEPAKGFRCDWAAEFPGQSTDMEGEQGKLIELRSCRVGEPWSSGVVDAIGTVEVVKLLRSAITESTPKAPHKNDGAVFELARKAVAAQLNLGKPFSEAELIAVIEEWFEGNDYKTESIDHYIAHFLRAFDNVNVPWGMNLSSIAYDRALADPLPPEADQFTDGRFKLLVALCYQMQKVMGESPFFLSCDTAEKLLGVSSQSINLWLYRLTRGGLLYLKEKGTRGGSKGRRAARYFYTPLRPVHPQTT